MVGACKWMTEYISLYIYTYISILNRTLYWVKLYAVCMSMSGEWVAQRSTTGERNEQSETERWRWCSIMFTSFSKNILPHYYRFPTQSCSLSSNYSLYTLYRTLWGKIDSVTSCVIAAACMHSCSISITSVYLMLGGWRLSQRHDGADTDEEDDVDDICDNILVSKKFKF